MSGVTGGDSVASPLSGPDQRLPSWAGSPSGMDTLVEGAPATQAACAEWVSLKGIRSSPPLWQLAHTSSLCLPSGLPSSRPARLQLTSEGTVRSLWNLPASSSSPWLSVLP